MCVTLRALSHIKRLMDCQHCSLFEWSSPATLKKKKPNLCTKWRNTYDLLRLMCYNFYRSEYIFQWKSSHFILLVPFECSKSFIFLFKYDHMTRSHSYFHFHSTIFVIESRVVCDKKFFMWLECVCFILRTWIYVSHSLTWRMNQWMRVAFTIY